MASYIVTGIHAAARAGKLQKVQDYIAKGGDVNKPDREDCTPLMWACWGGHIEIAKRLLDEGAKPDTFSHQHASPMHWATWGGHTEIVKLLLEHKVSLDESDEQDGTPLHYAAKKGFAVLAKLIVGAGASVDSRNVKNMTPLHLVSGINWSSELELACHYNKVEVARFLILKHAAVGSIDHINRTPLHYSCLKSHMNATKLLLEWGAEVMVIDNKGKLPLHLVGQSASQKNRGKRDDIIKLLKSKMPEDDDEGLDGSYHPESGGTLMGAAASVAKNLASHNSGSAAADGDAPTDSNSLPTADSSSVVDPSENGDNPPATNGESSHEHDANSASNGRVDGEPSAQGKSTRKADGSGSTRRPSVPPSSGGGGSAGNDWKAPGTGGGASSKAGSAAGGIEAMSGSTLDLSVSEKQRKKKSTINIKMADGVVSIGDGGKTTGNDQASPGHRRRGSNFAGLGITTAPTPGSRIKRSPQGSVTGGSSKGSEKDEMEEVSNEEVAYEMALEQIIADLDDLEERVENLNVDQKTNEDILLNVLKRVDETEKDLRKMKKSTINKDFEAKRANNGLDRTVAVDPPAPPALGGTTTSQMSDWPGKTAAGGSFATEEEVGELRQAIALKDKELRDIRNEMQDREADLDTLRKAGRNLRERLDEKDIETRDIMERLLKMEDAARAHSGSCNCTVM